MTVTLPAELPAELDQPQTQIRDLSSTPEGEQSQVDRHAMMIEGYSQLGHAMMVQEYSQLAEDHKRSVIGYRAMGEEFRRQHKEDRKMGDELDHQYFTLWVRQ